jgi:lipoyl(octanoyl) transferase
MSLVPYVSTHPVDYADAVAVMEARQKAIYQGCVGGAIWLLEHPPLYTAGTSAKADDLLAPRFPVYQTGRGGQYTYHGPRQLVAYVMMDLTAYGRDLHRFVALLEAWGTMAFAACGVTATPRAGRVGLWVDDHATKTEHKIAALGIRVKHWVTMHGIAFNIDPDLSHFSGIVPCGLRDYGVTSLAALGVDIDVPRFRDQLLRHCEAVFKTTLGTVVHDPPLAVIAGSA